MSTYVRLEGISPGAQTSEDGKVIRFGFVDQAGKDHLFEIPKTAVTEILNALQELRIKADLREQRLEPSSEMIDFHQDEEWPRARFLFDKDSNKMTLYIEDHKGAQATIPMTLNQFGRFAASFRRIERALKKQLKRSH